MSRLTITLEEDLLEEISKIASKEYRTKASVIRLLLRKALKKQQEASN